MLGISILRRGLTPIAGVKPFLFFDGESVMETLHRSRTRKTPQMTGFVCFVGPSRSAGFWAVLKGTDRIDYFAYGRSFLTAVVPKVGQQVQFTRLPAVPGSKLPRAIEVAVFNSNARPR